MPLSGMYLRLPSFWGAKRPDTNGIGPFKKFGCGSAYASIPMARLTPRRSLQTSHLNPYGAHRSDARSAPHDPRYQRSASDQ